MKNVPFRSLFSLQRNKTNTKAADFAGELHDWAKNKVAVKSHCVFDIIEILKLQTADWEVHFKLVLSPRGKKRCVCPGGFAEPTSAFPQRMLTN